MVSVTLPVFLSLISLVYGGKDKPVFSEEIKEIIQTLHDECVGKTGVAEHSNMLCKWNLNPDVVYNAVLKEDITNCENGIFKEDAKLKCYMFCLLEEAGLADENDIVDYDMLVSMIPEEYYDRATNMIFACKHLDTPDKDRCQRAFDVHKCSHKKDPDLYFLF